MKKLSNSTKSILWACAYFGLTVALTVSGCVAFHRYYYCSVFVSGTSMEPTLLGGSYSGNQGIANYGIIDITDHALKGIKRFDIITTYYPWNKTDYQQEIDPVTGEEYYKPGHSKPDGVNPDRKIKRIIAMPRETISIINGDIIIGKIPETVTSIKYFDDEEGLDEKFNSTIYKFGVIPTGTDYKMKYFRAADSHYMYFANQYEDAYNISFEEANKNGGFYFRYLLKKNIETWGDNEYKYINVHSHLVKDDQGDVVSEEMEITYDMTPETVWTYSDKYKTIKTSITDTYFSENSGDYIFTTTSDVDSDLFKLTKTTLMDSQNLQPVQVIKRDFDNMVVYSRELIKNNKSYENYELLKDYKTNYIIPFKREFDQREYSVKDQKNEIVLLNDRYWVQGDHWSSSTDCGDSGHGPIYYENIEGVLVAIEGTCEITTNSDGKKECINHKRMIPKLL